MAAQYLLRYLGGLAVDKRRTRSTKEEELAQTKGEEPVKDV